MNAMTQAQRAYSAVSAPTRTPRRAEFEAVAQITQKLRFAASKGIEGFPALAEALNDNRKLWNIFLIDVSDPKNPLPDDLRARIFYLAEFTRAHTVKVLARKADVEPLIEVNTAILRGLRGGAD
ncbi:MAG: flagellar biosynthesis regulator FlhF [Pseudooceanicola sp.]|nr:flagellar biosynthesis regulator FlhF [Pseudooceanicola sp.]